MGRKTGLEAGPRASVCRRLCRAHLSLQRRHRISSPSAAADAAATPADAAVSSSSEAQLEEAAAARTGPPMPPLRRPARRNLGAGRRRLSGPEHPAGGADSADCGGAAAAARAAKSPGPGPSVPGSPVGPGGGWRAGTAGQRSAGRGGAAVTSPLHGELLLTRRAAGCAACSTPCWVGCHRVNLPAAAVTRKPDSMPVAHCSEGGRSRGGLPPHWVPTAPSNGESESLCTTRSLQHCQCDSADCRPVGPAARAAGVGRHTGRRNNLGPRPVTASRSEPVDRLSEDKPKEPQRSSHVSIMPVPLQRVDRPPGRPAHCDCTERR
jgi:hypothetical protein